MYGKINSRGYYTLRKHPKSVELNCGTTVLNSKSIHYGNMIIKWP